METTSTGATRQRYQFDIPNFDNKYNSNDQRAAKLRFTKTFADKYNQAALTV